MRGELLATISRGDSTELRIVRDEFKGFPFVSLRVWNAMDDVWYPDAKRGVTIRPRELPDVLAALGRAAGALDNDGSDR